MLCSIVADLEIIRGVDFFFLSFPFFFLPFFLIISSQKMKEGLKEGLHWLFGSRGAGAPLDPVLDPPLMFQYLSKMKVSSTCNTEDSRSSLI